MSDQPAGPIVDSVGATLDVDDNQRITELVIIGKVIDMDHTETGAALVIGASHGLDWIAQNGLLHSALDAMRSESPRHDEE